MTPKNRYTRKKLRNFIGAKDYALSQAFYRELGYEVVSIDEAMSLIKIEEHMAFYLQRAYVKDWVDNLMMFMEVDDVDAYHLELASRDIMTRCKLARLSDVQDFPYGRQCFMHDPSGVLWHICQFQ